MATPTTLPASFTAGQVLTAAQMNDLRGAFRVLQTVTTTKTDTFTTTSTSFTDVTGLSVSITPQATSSTILCIVTANVSCDPALTTVMGQLVRGSTAIAIGDAASNRIRASFNTAPGAQSNIVGNTISFIDSPATTSATTYKLQICSKGATTAAVNRSTNDPDNTGAARVVSTITVMEISA